MIYAMHFGVYKDYKHHKAYRAAKRREGPRAFEVLDHALDRELAHAERILQHEAVSLWEIRGAHL